MRLRTIVGTGVVLLLIAGCEGPTGPKGRYLIEQPIPPSAPFEIPANLEVVSASITAQLDHGGTAYNLATLKLRETSGVTDAVIRSIFVAAEPDSMLTNEDCWRFTLSVPAGTTVDIAPLLGYCEPSFWNNGPSSLLRVTVTYGGGVHISTLVAPIPAE